jgi:hypothetical protein
MTPTFCTYQLNHISQVTFNFDSNLIKTQRKSEPSPLGRLTRVWDIEAAHDNCCGIAPNPGAHHAHLISRIILYSLNIDRDKRPSLCVPLRWTAAMRDRLSITWQTFVCRSWRQWISLWSLWSTRYEIFYFITNTTVSSWKVYRVATNLRPNQSNRRLRVASPAEPDLPVTRNGWRNWPVTWWDHPFEGITLDNDSGTIRRFYRGPLPIPDVLQLEDWPSIFELKLIRCHIVEISDVKSTSSITATSTAVT